MLKPSANKLRRLDAEVDCLVAELVAKAFLVVGPLGLLGLLGQVYHM